MFMCIHITQNIVGILRLCSHLFAYVKCRVQLVIVYLYYPDLVTVGIIPVSCSPFLNSCFESSPGFLPSFLSAFTQRLEVLIMLLGPQDSLGNMLNTAIAFMKIKNS